MHKKYTSFEELDKDIKIAKLKRDIDVQSLKNGYQNIREYTRQKKSSKKMIIDVTRQLGISLLSFRGSLLPIVAGYAVEYFLKKKITKR